MDNWWTGNPRARTSQRFSSRNAPRSYCMIRLYFYVVSLLPYVSTALASSEGERRRDKIYVLDQNYAILSPDSEQ